MPNRGPKRFPWTIYVVTLLFIAVVALAPIFSVVACSCIANAYGCKVDEGSAHPCVINGVDRGELLYALGVMGWFMLVTLPAGAFAMLVWIVVLLVHRSNWRKRGIQMG